jgi:hypothetical protein
MNKEDFEIFIAEHSTYEAARHFNCSQTNIRYWLKKFGIRKEQKYNEIRICKKCGKEFSTKKGLIDFCSMACRNTRERSNETKKKISDSMKTSQKGMQSIKNLHEINSERFAKVKYDREQDIEAYNNKKKQERAERFMNKNFGDLGIDAKRARIMHEQGYRCHKCGLAEWFDEPIALEVEHIDGEHSNNKRENLIALCPNCHSLTTTWRGRNKKGERRITISDETILEALIKFDFNTRQALLSLGMAAKGGNYPRCHRIKKVYEAMLEDQKGQ